MISVFLIAGQVILFSLLIGYVTQFKRIHFFRIPLYIAGGILAALTPFYLQFSLAEAGLDRIVDFGSVMLNAFVYVAFNEEFFKFVFLLAFLYLVPWVKSGLELLACSLFLALGFAGFENYLYAENFGIETGLFRGITAIPAHLCFAVVMGYFLFFGRLNRKYIFASLFITVLIHGIYDFFIIQEFADSLTIGALVILLGLLLVSWKMIRNMYEITGV